MNLDTKPYDTAFKDLAEQSPELLLRLVGALPPNATVTVLPREVSAPMLATDQPYEIVSPTEHFIAHLEEQTRWEADLPERVAAYQAALWAKYRLPLRSYVLLLTARGLSAEAVTSCVIEAEGLALHSRFTLVKVWELSAAQALALNNEDLLPFVTLMAGGEAELEQAARALGQVADDLRKRQLALHFVVVGGLRYDKDYLYDLIGRLTMIPIHAYRESSVYQFILDEGRTTGQRELLTDMLQRMAQRRFPDFMLGAEVERVHDLKALEDLCLDIDALPDEAALRAQLQALVVNGKQHEPA